MVYVNSFHKLALLFVGKRLIICNLHKNGKQSNKTRTTNGTNSKVACFARFPPSTRNRGIPCKNSYIVGHRDDHQHDILVAFHFCTFKNYINLLSMLHFYLIPFNFHLKLCAWKFRQQNLDWELLDNLPFFFFFRLFGYFVYFYSPFSLFFPLFKLNFRCNGYLPIKEDLKNGFNLFLLICSQTKNFYYPTFFQGIQVFGRRILGIS